MAALRVSLANVNEAPVAKATASPERVREGVWVTLHGSASTGPGCGRHADLLVDYGPAADADAELADHQVAAPTEGETLVVVTVTAADETVRRYRVVVAPTAAGSNTAPTGLPTITGTP